MGSGWLSYIQHLRPMSFPIEFLHMITGLAIGYVLFPVDVPLWRILLGIFVYVVLLNGGTLAYNSSFDNDEGDIGWLDSPPAKPRGLVLFSLIIHFVGFLLCALINVRFFIGGVIIILLSLAYSGPPLYLKRRPWFDFFINAIGYGSLVLYMGYALLDLQLTLTISVILSMIFILWGAGYLLTQLYQYSSDRRNKYRTTAQVLGIRGVFIFAIASAALLLGLVVYSSISGIIPFITLIFMAPLFCYGAYYLFSWKNFFKKRNAKHLMYRGYILVALFDVFLFLAFVVDGFL